MPDLNLSVCILALNEEKQISNALKSVCEWVGEIVVVVDDNTVDKTFETANRFTDRVFIKPHRDNFHLNKQIALELASCEWVLWLDADEYVDKELKQEIISVLDNPRAEGYMIPRKNIIFGKWIEHAGWYPDYQLRLFKRNNVRFPAQSIHEQPHLEGRIGRLDAAIMHNNYENINHFIEKLNRYTTQDSLKERRETELHQVSGVVKRPVEEFIKRFLYLQGYKDGSRGLILSLLQAMYELVVAAKNIEAGGFSGNKSNSLIQEVETQIRYGIKSWRWWKREIQIKEADNFLYKLWLRGLRKLGL